MALNKELLRKNLPLELQNCTRWVVWRLEDFEGRERCKMPLQARFPTRHAKSNDFDTWVSFEEVMSVSLPEPLEKYKHEENTVGIGLVFGAPFVGIDLDKCRDPETGEVEQWAKDILFKYPTYTELGPSLKGFHLWYRCPDWNKLPRGHRRAKAEIYRTGRYFTITGLHVPGSPKTLTELTQAQANELFTLIERMKKSEAKAPATQSSSPKFEKLMTSIEFPNLSDAVQSLLVHLCYLYPNDLEYVEKKFKESKLYQETHWKEKWDRLGKPSMDKAMEFAKTHPRTVALQPEEGAIVLEGGRLNEAVEASEKVIASHEDLWYFARGGDLVRPVRASEAETVAGVKRDRVSVVIQVLSIYSIIRDLEKHASFVQNCGKAGYKPATPTENLAKHIQDRVRIGQAPYRELTMVCSTPTLLPDGSVLDTPGYRDGVFLIPSSTVFPPIPEKPTLEDAQEALRKFDAIYRLFPFERRGEENWNQSAAYATVLAATLSLIARPAIPTVPLFSVTSPVAGSGKTKVAEAITVSSCDSLPTTVTYESSEEFAKLLVPLLREGDRAILIDNVSGSLRGDRLSAVITSEKHRARVLGKSEDIELVNRAVFLATGINLVVEGDLAARRTLQIALDPDCERPEERDFDFEPVALARELHPVLVSAALTALRAYIVAGHPKVLGRAFLGSFEAWDKLVCGCLVWCGYADPHLTRERVVTRDPQREADLELLSTWLGEYGPRPVTLRQIQGDQKGVHRLLQAGQGEWDGKAVGWRLRKLEGRVVGGLKLTKSPGFRASYQVQGNSEIVMNKELPEQEEINNF